MVLLLEDYQFVHTAFLEMVNSLLSSGLYCVCVFVFPCLYFYKNRFNCFDLKLHPPFQVKFRIWVRLMIAIKEKFDILGITLVPFLAED